MVSCRQVSPSPLEMRQNEHDNDVYVCDCSFCVCVLKLAREKNHRFLDSLRQLEVDMNSAFDQYRQLYYDGGIASVYLWETTDDVESFAGSVLFKKAGLGSQMIKGCWDSIHVFEVTTYEGQVSYKLTTTIMLWLQTDTDDCGLLNLGGSLTRQFEHQVVKDHTFSHICEIGKLIEQSENKIRASLNTVYFGKTRDIVNSLRSPVPLSVSDTKNRQMLHAELGKRLSMDPKV